MADPTRLSSPTAEVRVELHPDAKRERLEHCIATVETFQASSLTAAEAIAEIHADKLWTGEADSFHDFVHDRFGIRRRRAYQLAKAGLLYGRMKTRRVDPLPTSEAQLRPLTALDDLGEQIKAWKLAIKENGGAVANLTQEAVDVAVAGVQGLGRHRRGASEPRVDGAMSQRARDYAVIEDELASKESSAPSPALHAQHYDTLGSLDAADQAEVWKRVGEAEPNGTTALDGLLEAGSDTKDDKHRRAAIGDAVVALAGEMPGASTAAATTDTLPGNALHVLLERDLLPEEVVAGLPGDAVTKIGGSILVDYELAGEAIGGLVEVLDHETPGDIKTRVSALKRPDLHVRRQMARTRLEPDVAAWAWHVLIPHPTRSARAWIPDADAAAPCYAPARLTQPANTDPEGLVVTEGDRPAYDIPVARCALIAPGVDLLHHAVPDEVVKDVLDRAGKATGFGFLAVTREVKRLARTSWPLNVRPVVPVTTPDEVNRAVNAFEESGCPGVLVFVDYEDKLSENQQARLKRTRPKRQVSAVLVRGERRGRTRTTPSSPSAVLASPC